MKLLTAKVVDGHLDLPAGSLKEGAVVTIALAEGDTGFEVTPAEKALLLESIAELDRGEGVDGWELLEEIRHA